MFLEKFKSKRNNTEKYPVKVELEFFEKTLKYEVFSSVEKFRIADYGGEKSFLDHFVSALNEDDIVFDVGASVGLMTVHSAVTVGKGKVFAFEPDPEVLNRLKHNVELNNLSNVIYVPWAVSDSQGEVTLYSDGASGFAPSLRKQADRLGAPKGQVIVQAKTLDDAISSGELPHPTILKVDIEGAEILCIRGALRLIRGEFGAKPRLIFMELHPEFLPDYNSTADEVHELMLKQGYKVVWEDKRDDQLHYCYQGC